MDEQITQQLIVGVVGLVVGVSGWLLPYRWNLLRLRGGLAGLLPERWNHAIPKIVGTVLALAGIAVLIATGILGRFR
jgi:hypothetical protein